ncbi:hypothetical protein S83_008723, partial [Arachis hypogaea]
IRGKEYLFFRTLCGHRLLKTRQVCSLGLEQIEEEVIEFICWSFRVQVVFQIE